MNSQQPAQTPPIVQPQVPAQPVEPVQPTPQPLQPQTQTPIPPAFEVKKEKKSPLLGIVFILFALILGGVFAANYFGLISFTKTQPTATIASIPTAMLDETANWKTYQLSQLKMSFKMPLSLNPSGELKFTTSHSDLYWNNSVESLIKLAATSTKSTFEGGFSYLNGCIGYKKIETGYKFLTYTKAEVDIPAGLTTEITNQNQIKYLIIKSDPSQTAEGMPPIGTTEKGHLAAIINTNNMEYPALVIQMKLSTENTEDIFNQILSTFKFIDQTTDTSDWKTYSNSKLGIEFKYPKNLYVGGNSFNDESEHSAIDTKLVTVGEGSGFWAPIEFSFDINKNTLSEIIDFTKSQFSPESLKVTEIVSDGKVKITLISGLISWDYLQGQRLPRTIFANSEGKTITFTYTGYSLGREKDISEDLFKQIVSTIKLVK